MRIIATLGLALTLAGCEALPARFDSAPDRRTAISVPSQAIPIQDQDVLFWSDAVRSDRFRRMEDFFPGIDAIPTRPARVLPQGAPLPTEAQALLDRYGSEANAAGIMVLQDGKIRYARYGLGFTPTDRWTSFSVAKSFTSTLLGAAVKDGHIESLDDPVSKYVPQLVGSGYEVVSVGQLATMTSGLAWNEDYTDPNSDVAQMFAVAPVQGETQAVTYAKKLEREAPPGEKWVYKTLETNLIGEVVERATGRTLADYAQEKIVNPAGFEGELFWMTDLTSGNIGGCCLSLRLSDYARFGQFVLEGGGDVVPDGWFGEATDSQVDFGDSGFGYGYQWWTYPAGNYGAQGIFGQSITLIPEKKLVVAIVSNWPVASERARANRRLEVITAVANSLED